MNRTKEELEIYEKIKNILISSSKPSVGIIKMIKEGELDNYPFKMILDLKNIEQNQTFHKEGNVFNHIMLVIDKASMLKEKTENRLVFMLSALLHDLGKLTTTKTSKTGKITSYNHDKASSKLVNEFLAGFENDEVINKVYNLTLYHMQSLYFQHNSNMFNLRGILLNVEINDLCLLTLADRTGRVGFDEEKEREGVMRFKDYLREHNNKIKI